MKKTVKNLAGMVCAPESSQMETTADLLAMIRTKFEEIEHEINKKRLKEEQEDFSLFELHELFEQKPSHFPHRCWECTKCKTRIQENNAGRVYTKPCQHSDDCDVVCDVTGKECRDYLKKKMET